MVLHSSEIVPLLEWMRLWDTDSWTARAKTYLIFGPTGCGKTSLIYALATQYGYKVFEVNPSSCRSGKEVTSQCSPVMVSQHVSTEALSVSSSASGLSKVSILSSDKAMFQSRKSTLDPYSLPNKRPSSRSISQLDSLKRGASEGLKLINKSLILFDDVDVLFDADRGFWHAVGKLLQMGRRPIFFTASDPSVLRKIPVPYQTCKLLPLASSTLAKPILQRICDSRGLILTDSLMLALTRRDDEDCNFDMPDCISSTAKEVVNSREFSNIRQSIVRLQWITGSGNQHLDGESTRTSGYDLMNACNSTFHRLFSLSFAIPRISSQGPAKSTGNEFVDVFASDVEEKPLVSEEHEKQLKTSNVVKLPLPQCRKLSADVLSELFRATELQALLDMCSAVSGRNEISRGIESLPLNITSSLNLMTVFGDVCSAPLSGIDPVGISGTFACEEEWRRLLHLTTLHNLTRLEERLLSLPMDSESLSFGSYIDERSDKDYFSSVVFDKAVGTLASLRAFNEERKSGDCFFQRESALDFLPALRSIGRAESRRKSSATRRRFFHYFDQIGLHLPQDVRKFLSQ
ncbi:atpase aaa type core [Echinococcus multilocularis]|uniref:Atpase aaa type core n=1 Tax=Echinococcus multilocularis TaxID=6211 RepID=A0A068YID6_ECHMU|nr:atpase aaa type core [Echinococcus multilocularis]